MSNNHLDYIILSETLDNLEDLRNRVMEYIKNGWEVVENSIIIQPNRVDKQFCALQKIKHLDK